MSIKQFSSIQVSSVIAIQLQWFGCVFIYWNIQLFVRGPAVTNIEIRLMFLYLRDSANNGLFSPNCNNPLVAVYGKVWSPPVLFSKQHLQQQWQHNITMEMQCLMQKSACCRVRNEILIARALFIEVLLLNGLKLLL